MHGPSEKRRHARVIVLGTPEDTRAEIIRGLQSAEKSLPTRLLYDERGARLFEKITALPEYYLTRVEATIFPRCFAEVAKIIGPHARVVEYGSGAMVKIEALLRALETPAAYVGVDISREQLEQAIDAFALRWPALDVAGVCANFRTEVELPTTRGARALGFFAGSTIGNFVEHEAEDFLRRVRSTLAGGGLLLGADMQKDSDVLHAAYNDSQGVTEAFIKNILANVNDVIGSNFDPDAYRMHARYSVERGRIEIYLVSERDQFVAYDATGFAVARDERIFVEYSHKYTEPQIRALAARAGFSRVDAWYDANRWFGLFLLYAD